MDAKELNALVHDREAAAYDTRFLIEQGPRLGEELMREVRDLLGDKFQDGGRVLDVACGTGFAALGAAHSGLGAQIHACDLSVEMVRVTASHAGDSALPVRIAACDAEKLCYADQQFDLVIARGALHHVPDPVAMLAECKRVLKPGGTLLCLAEPTEAGERQVGLVVGSIWRAFETLRKLSGQQETAEEAERKHWELASMAANLHTFDAQDLETMAIKAGFEEIETGTAWWAWVLVLGVNYFLAGEFERAWSQTLVRRVARSFLDAAALFDMKIGERLVPSKYHATVWAVLR